MSFNLGDVINETIERLTTTAGAIIVGALTIIGIVQTAAIQDIIRGMLEWFLVLLDDPEFREQVPAEDMQELEAVEQEINAYISDLALSLGLSPGIAALLWSIMFVLSLVVVIIAIDTFANRRDTLDGIETPRIGWKTLNLLAGWIVFGILFVVGLILLVIPGILVGIFLVFFAAAIVIDGDSFVSAFASSYRVARSNVVGTLGVVLLSLGAFIGLGFIGNVFGAILPELPAILLSNVLSGIGQAFSIALIALAYGQAVGEQPSVDSDPSDSTTT